MSNSEFIKEKFDKERIKKDFGFGVFMKKGKLPDDMKKTKALYLNLAKQIMGNYVAIQNKVDELTTDVAKSQVLGEILDFVVALDNLRTNMAYNYGVIAQCANNYSRTLASPCADVLMLEAELLGYTVDEHGKQSRADQLYLTQKEQERFAKYKFGTNAPVDKNADLFVSYLIPMVLAMNGYQVDKGFVDYMVSELNNKHMNIPSDLADLHSGANVKKAKVTENNMSANTAVITLEQRFVLQMLQDNFAQAQINETFANFIKTKNVNHLVKLNNGLSDFVDMLSNVTDGYDDRIMAEVIEDETLYTMAKLHYMFKTNELDEETLEEITQAFEELSEDEKKTDDGARTFALYSPIALKKMLDRKVKGKEIEENIQAEAVVDQIRDRHEQNKNVQVYSDEILDTSDAVVCNIQGDEVECSTTTNMPEGTKQVAKADIEEVAKTEIAVSEESEEIAEQEEIHQVTVEPLSMAGYAEMLFLEQKEYNLQKLSEVRFNTVIEIMGESVVKASYPFGGVIKSAELVVVDGKMQYRLKNLAATYDEVRDIYKNLEMPLQQGLLKHLGYVEMAKAQVDEMIDSYAVITDAEKELLNRLVVNDEVLKGKLDTRIQNLDKDRRDAMIKKEKELRTVNDILDRYNMKLTDVLKDDDKAAESISDFYRTVM